VDAVAALIQEFGLQEATWSGEDGGVTLRKRRSTQAVAVGAPSEFVEDSSFEDSVEAAPVAAAGPVGHPVTSPMNGIYYASSNPSSPPFVKEGDTVTAGQTIGLIEAMKVFNEVPASMSGTVVKIIAESGQLVQPGDPLIYIG
jgi:acetyl-CoA carboxylase biotin carboxyl carrier protein